MSAPYVPAVETVADPDVAVHYAWLIEYEYGTGLLPAVVPTDGRDPVVVAQQYDPRRDGYNKGRRAVLVKISVPLSEMRAL